MPPKKTLKDLQSSPVYGMPHEEQVRLLSDALLREYMHRRGFLDTLKAFDEENPRDAQTISSRALMSDLMALKTEEQAELKALGIETIMEMLIDLRVEKRQEVSALQEELTRPIPAVPADYVDAKTRIEKLRQKKREKANEGSDAGDDGNGDDGEKKRRKKKKSKKNKTAADEPENADGEHTMATEQRKAKKKAKKAKESSDDHLAFSDEAPPTMTLDDLLASGSGSSSSHSEADSHDSAASEDDGSRRTSHPTGPYLKPVEAPTWLRDAATGRAPGASSADHDGSEDDEAEAEADADNAVRPELPPPVLEGSEPLTQEAARAACRVLLGPQAKSPPAAFLSQGFVFDDLLEFALVQWQRGPGAVVAPVQALVSTFFYEKERYVGVPVRQREALQRALCAVLFKAQPDVQNVCVVDGRLASSSAPCRGFMTRMSRHFRAWTGFDKRQDVEAKVGELIEHHWSEEKDAGLWCFLVSVVLSRGAAAVAADMESSIGGGAGSGNTTGTLTGSDGGAHTLIDMKSGDGTEALANLCLTGRAVYFHHDGSATGKGGRLLRGYTSAVSCGLLDGDPLQHPLFAADTAESLTFRYARDPTYASWVVSHAGHYTNLFMTKDGRKSLTQKRALGGKASVELIYWDALTDDEDVTLTVTIDTAQSLGLNRGSTGASRQANASYVNRALLQVPDWSLGTVDWNGAKVIRD